MVKLIRMLNFRVSAQCIMRAKVDRLTSVSGIGAQENVHDRDD
jgi:hypothetical protein